MIKYIMIKYDLFITNYIIDCEEKFL